MVLTPPSTVTLVTTSRATSVRLGYTAAAVYRYACTREQVLLEV